MMTKPGLKHEQRIMLSETISLAKDWEQAGHNVE